MSVVGIILVSALIAAAISYSLRPTAPGPAERRSSAVVRNPIVTDLRICRHTLATSCDCKQGRGVQVTKKDLYCYQDPDKRQAWVCTEVVDETDLADDTLVVVSIVVGEQPSDLPSGAVWEQRDGGLWLLKQGYRDKQINHAVTGVDVLYGTDAVDPRQQWELMQAPLRLDAPSAIPAARLTVRYGRVEPERDANVLKIPEDGKFRIIQISDLHMTVGSGVCKDAMDERGRYLKPVGADPRTVEFVNEVLNRRKPNLVLLTGDLVCEEIQDSQTALFKAVAPMEARGISYTTVFGNHDAQGDRALSRTEQMALLQSLPNCLSEPGPPDVDGTGNYIVQIFAAAPSKSPALTLYLLDSHGAIPGIWGKLLSRLRNRFDHIKLSQIKWFLNTFQQQHGTYEQETNDNASCISLAVFHIPLPEFKDCDPSICIGLRREPTEGPCYNSRFYDALAEKNIAAVLTGHDHLNNFVAQLPRRGRQVGQPYLCSGGYAGFGAYGAYGAERTHRQVRCFDFDANARSLTTWMHVEYHSEPVDELVLVKDGLLIRPQDRVDGSTNPTMNRR